jgi:hypothetical protein
MKYSRILPAAAGIIALTATMGFARDQRENEDSIFRTRIAVLDSNSKGTWGTIYRNQFPVAIDSETGLVYLVEIERSNKTTAVSIDACTGKILGSREMPDDEKPDREIA